MTKFKVLLIVASIAAVACSSNKKAEDKSATTTPAGGTEVASVEKSKDKMTTVEGQIAFTNPTFDPSTGIQNVKLLRNGKVVSQASTNPDGTFTFKGIFENGDYLVKVDSKTLVGSASLKINGYEVKDFVLPATLTSPTNR